MIIILSLVCERWRNVRKVQHGFLSIPNDYFIHLLFMCKFCRTLNCKCRMVFAGNSARLLYAFLQVALDGGASVKSGLFRVKFLRRERSRIGSARRIFHGISRFSATHKHCNGRGIIREIIWRTHSWPQHESKALPLAAPSIIHQTN